MGEDVQGDDGSSRSSRFSRKTLAKQLKAKRLIESKGREREGERENEFFELRDHNRQTLIMKQLLFFSWLMALRLCLSFTMSLSLSLSA